LLARERTVVLAIDDAQWLDAATREVLAFALRRLDVDPVGILATVRVAPEAGAPGLVAAIPEDRAVRLRVGALTVASLFEIVRDRFGLTLPRAVLIRIHQESRGNPFYALVVARMLSRSTADLRPGDPLPVPPDLRELVRTRLAQLSPPAAEVVLAAAALARPTVPLLEHVFGDVDDAFAEATAAGVVETEDATVRLSHPLLASVHCELSPRSTRREIHRRLAVVSADPEERARHLALASPGPDTDVARTLDEAAAQPRRLGALASAAQLAELAAKLTPADAPEISSRPMKAAELHNSCGEVGRARRLLDAALDHAPAESVRPGSKCRSTTWRRALLPGGRSTSSSHAAEQGEGRGRRATPPLSLDPDAST
jgi:hypothetical protein